MKGMADHRTRETLVERIPCRFISVSSPRTLAVVLALVGNLSQPLWALGLGQIKSSSLLGQRLEARIDIVGEDKSFSLDELKISRVGVTEAASVGFDLLTDGYGIRVAPVSTRNGWQIKVTSARPIAEPFLNFVVKLDWPKGSLYREYTLLLDPPNLNLALRDANGQTSQTLPVQDNGWIQHTQAAPTHHSVGNRYRVRMGDSLLSLAEQWLGSQATSNAHELSGNRAVSSPMSLDEVVQWLFANNPRAFSRNSANSLMAGALLQFPDVSLERHSLIPAREEQKQAMHDGATAAMAFEFPLDGERALILSPSQQSLPQLALNTERELDVVAMPVVSAGVAAIASSQGERPSLLKPKPEPKLEPEPQLESRLQSRLRLGTSPNIQRWQERSFDREASDLWRGREPLAEAAADKTLEAPLIAMMESQLDASHEIVEQLQRDNRDLRDRLQRIEESNYLETLTELVRLQRQQLAQLRAQQSQQSTPSKRLSSESLLEGGRGGLLVADASPVNRTEVSSERLSMAITQQLEYLDESVEQRDRGVVASIDQLVDVYAKAELAPVLATAPHQTRAGFMAVDKPSAHTLRSMLDATKPSPWHWAASLLLPLVLMGLYLWVAIRRQSELSPQGEESLLGGVSSPQARIDLDTRAATTEEGTNTIDTPADHSHHQSSSAHQYGQTIQWHSDDPWGENTHQHHGWGYELNPSQPTEHTPEYLTAGDGSDVRASDYLEHTRDNLERSFNRELDQVSTPNLSEAIAKIDNVVFFPSVGHSDEELKRRIQNKVCNYQPPQPEPSSYIVQEEIEDIDRYLDIQMIEAPQINLDESSDNEADNALNDHHSD